MRRVDVVFFLLVLQTTCRVTSCQRSVPASSPPSSPLRSTWWRPGTWTHRQASTTAPSTVPGPWWLKRGQRLSTRGKLCLSDRGSMFGFKIPSSPDFFFFFLLQRFVPSFLRLGSWNVVMFVSFEQIKRAMMVTKKNIEAHNWDHSFTVGLKTWSGPEAVRGNLPNITSSLSRIWQGFRAVMTRQSIPGKKNNLVQLKICHHHHQPKPNMEIL